MTTIRRAGRNPKRAVGDHPVTVTIRIDPKIKNSLIDLANAYDLSISELIATFVRRETPEPQQVG